jgi:hypothetical protein
MNGQILNQDAAWPNGSWTITGSYDATAAISLPDTGSTFAYDDDAAGSGSTNNIAAESPVINLSAAVTGGETWLTVTIDYVYNKISTDVLQLQYWDAGTSSWVLWEDYPEETVGTYDYQTCINQVTVTSAILDISGFTSTQQTGFKYRILYDDNAAYAWGFCCAAPTITSEAPPTCPDPSDLYITNITSSSADAFWTDNAGASSWAVEYDTTGFPQGSGTTLLVADTSASISGLAAGEDYDCYVRAICGTGDSSMWIGPVTFRIPGPGEACTEALTVSVVADCSAADSTHVDFNNAVDIGLTGCDAVATNNGFWYKFVAPASTSVNLIVSPDSTGFEAAVYDVCGGTEIFCNTSTTAGSTRFISGLTPSNTYYLVIWRDGTQTFTTSFCLEAGPDCVDPTALNVDNVTSSSADANWMVNGLSTSFHLEYDTSGFPLGTGTVITTGTLGGPISMSGLMEQTEYDVYVYEVCDGNNTDTLGPVSFTTLCGVQAADYCEGFEGLPTNTAPHGDFGNCWVSTSTSDPDWTLEDSNTGSSNTGPEGPYAGGSRYVYLETSSGSEGDSDTLTGPEVNTSTLTNPQLSFYYHMYGATMGKLQWEASDDGGSSWTTLDSLVGEQQTADDEPWLEQTANLSSFSSPVMIRFIGFRGSSFTGDMALDSICINETPSCPPPTDLTATNITTNSADLGWTENGDAKDWEIEWDTSGFMLGTGTSILTNANPYSLSGLNVNTSYGFYVRAICGVGDTSSWSGPLVFRTLCNSFTVPFCEGFNSTSTSESCWTVLNENSDADEWDLDYTFNPLEGDQVAMMFTDFNGGDNDDWLISPAIVLTGGDQLRYYQRAASTTEIDPYEVRLSTTGILPADFTTILLTDTAQTTTYVERVIDLSSYSGTINLAWRVLPSVGDGWRVYIDSVCVEVIPTCLPPSDLAVTNITATGADVSWTDNASTAAWNVQYGTSGFALGTGTTVPVTTTPATTLSGLMNVTEYDVYVQADCGGTDTSVWVGPASFTTLPTVPPACAGLVAPADDAMDQSAVPPIVFTLGVDADSVTLYGGTHPDTLNNIGQFVAADTIELIWPGRSLSTTYYWQAIPSNIIGPSTNCPIWSFTVQDAPPASSSATCSSGNLAPTIFESFSSTVPLGWTGDIGTSVNQWNLTKTGSTTSGGTGPSSAHEGSYYAYFESSVTSDSAEIVTDTIDLTGVTDAVELGFHVHMYGSEMGTMYVDVSSSPTGPWTNLIALSESYQGLDTYPWLPVALDLSAYAGSKIFVRFKAVKPAPYDGFTSDMAIDELTISTCVACPDPSDLTASSITTNSADLGWTENGSASSWIVEWDTSGFTQGAGTSLVAGTNPYNLSSLASNTSYDFYVRAYCGVGDSSDWVGPYSFSTLCDAYNVPFCEGFNSSSTSESCWTVLDENGDTDAWDLNYTLNELEGDQVAMMYTDFNSGNNDDWLISPGLILTGNEQLRFYQRAASTSEIDPYQVKISTSGIAPVDFSTTLLIDTARTTTYVERIIDLSAYTGTVYLAWHVPPSTTDGWRVYIDSVCVEAIPSCPDPSDLSASNISSDGADLSWTENGSSTTWNVQYGLAPLTLGTGTTVVVNTSSSTSLSGLMASSDYDVYVQSDCGGTDTSSWVGPVSFTTLCAAYVPYYIEDFATFLPDCWQEAGNVAGGEWTSDDFANNTSDPRGLSAKINIYDTEDDTLFSPEFDLSGGGPYELTFDVALTNFNQSTADTFGTDDQVQLWVSTDGGTSWNELMTWNRGTEPSTTGDSINIDLSLYTGTVQFAYWASGGVNETADYDFFVDDFEIREISGIPCPPSLTLTGTIIGGAYQTSDSTYADGTIEIGSNVIIKTNTALLDFEFEVELGGEMEIQNDPCTP